MPNKLNHLHIKNFRSLADVHITPDSLNILFGPNGAGKSTFLDTIWFIRDCAIKGVVQAAFSRGGIGILWDGANTKDNILISIENESAKYEVSFGFNSERIKPFAGEILINKINNQLLLNRIIGSDEAKFYHSDIGQDEINRLLRKPEKLTLSTYADETGEEAALELDQLLSTSCFYQFKLADLVRIKRYDYDSGSEPETLLKYNFINLWSVLKSLYDKQVIDDRYDTIMKFMRESFPTFDGLYFEQTGRNTVYANFLDKRRRKPIQASGVSDGHLQMLINLTALFSEKPNGYSLILLDEPEISLHPWALAVFAKAVKLATEKWNKQVFIATHSPVLISQFEPKNIWATELDADGKTLMKRVSEIADIQDLLEEYATGSLYMAEAIAPQSKFGSEELSQ